MNMSFMMSYDYMLTVLASHPTRATFLKKQKEDIKILTNRRQHCPCVICNLIASITYTIEHLHLMTDINMTKLLKLQINRF